MVRPAQRVLTLALLLAAVRSPGVTVEVEGDSVGMGEVTWSEQTGDEGTTRLTLAAEAASRHVFAGWRVENGGGAVWPTDFRYPKRVTVDVPTSAVVRATFIPMADDSLEFDLSDLLEGEIARDEPVDIVLSVDSASFPSLTFSGLPKGMAYRSQTLTLAGAPSESGVYPVTVSGRNESGYTFQDYFTIRVGNTSGPRLSGENVEIPLGAYYQAEFA